MIGCSENKPTTRPSNWADQAEADPMHFDPKLEDNSVTGNQDGHFDKKAFDRDLDDVLNP